MSFPGPRWAQSRLGRLLGHHYAFVVTRWGFGKSMATILARAGGTAWGNAEDPGACFGRFFLVIGGSDNEELKSLYI